MPNPRARHYCAQTAQYRFDETGRITLVPSKANERGPDETQADLDTALREQRDLPLWASDDGPRIAPEED